MTSPDTHADSIAELLGDFRIVRELGRGGMGIVYEALQVSLNRRVALKVLPLAAAFDAQRLARFRSEVRAAALLAHPNIVSIYVVGCEQGVHFYAMQYVDGQTLGQMITDLHFQQIESNVNQTDEERRRSSPGGRIRDPGGRRITSRSRTRDRSSRRETDESHCGFRRVSVGHRLRHCVFPAGYPCALHGHMFRDPALHEPQQITGRDSDSSDRRTDIYSLGVTLYELLTLQEAFPGDEPHSVLRHVVEGDCCLPRRSQPGDPTGLEAIVRKAMQPIADQRYATAADLADDLRRFCDSRPTIVQPPSIGPPVTDRKVPRRRAALSVLAALVVLTACGWFAVSQTFRRLPQSSRDERASADVTNLQHAWDAIRAMTEAASEERQEHVEPPVNQNPLKRQILEHAIAFYEPFTAVDSENPEDRLLGLRALCEIGTLLAELRQYPEATERLQMAIDQAREYAVEDEHDLRYLRQLADACTRLAAAWQEQRRESEAREKGQQAMAIQTELLAQCPGDAGLLSESALTLGVMALVEMQAKRWHDAAGLLRQAIKRQQAALTMTPGERDELHYQKRLCDHYVSLHECLRQGKIGEPGELEDDLRHIAHWSEQIVAQQPVSVPFRWRKGDACQALAELLTDSPARLEEATQWANEAVDCFTKLAAEDRDVPAFGHRCGHALGCLATLMQRRGELTQCRTHMERAVRSSGSVRSWRPREQDLSEVPGDGREQSGLVSCHLYRHAATRPETRPAACAAGRRT